MATTEFRETDPPPEGCHWIGPWRPLDDPIWKWTRYYQNKSGSIIACVERRES